MAGDRVRTVTTGVRRLEKHLRFNRYSNVHVEQNAAGSEAGEADLYLVDGFRIGATFEAPGATGSYDKVRVRVRRIDDVLAKQSISKWISSSSTWREENWRR